MKENLKYKGVDFSDIESDREFYGCTFEECSFARAKLTNVLFSRCEFIRCDFSLCKIYGVSFQDVRFVGCKMLGVDFTSSGLRCDQRKSSGLSSGRMLSISSGVRAKSNTSRFCFIRSV